MCLGEAVDGDRDVGPLDTVGRDAHGTLKIGRRESRRRIASHRLQALRDVLGSSAGIEGKLRLTFEQHVTDGALPHAAAERCHGETVPHQAVIERGGRGGQQRLDLQIVLCALDQVQEFGGRARPFGRLAAVESFVNRDGHGCPTT